jgi:hypothetical protein
MAAKTTVVNLKNTQYDVYIGRAGHGHDGYFGNPHIVGYCGLCKAIHKHGETLIHFEKYFYDRVERDLEFRRRVLELRGKVLGCFCYPRACHGMIIAQWLDNQ